MKGRRIGLGLLLIGLGGASGCENLAARHETMPGFWASEAMAGSGEDSGSHGPLGSRDSAQTARRGAWSSEAAQIEQSLTTRQVDPSW